MQSRRRQDRLTSIRILDIQYRHPYTCKSYVTERRGKTCEEVVFISYSFYNFYNFFILFYKKVDFHLRNSKSLPFIRKLRDFF